MTEDEAVQIQSRALRAIRELNAIAALPLDWEADESLLEIKRGIGVAIGQIEFEILNPIYQRFPEIDDLRDMDLSQFDALLKDQP